MRGKYVIYPLHLGTIVRPKINMAYMKDPGTEEEYPIIAWYLTDGFHKIMVDTGGIPADGLHYLPYMQTPKQTMERSLRRIGVLPEEVTHVISTHLHWDHIGSNHLFTNAEFFVQLVELQYAFAPLPIHKGGYNAAMIRETNYNTVHGDCDLLPGISLLSTPGHSPGSQSVLIETKEEEYMITGDCIALYECYESEPMIPNGVHTDLIEYYNQMERIKRMKKKVLPGHDFKVFTQGCYQ